MPSLVRSRTCYPLGSGFSAQPPRAIVVGIAGTVDDLSKSIRAPRQVGGATPKIVGDKGGAVREFAKTVNETGEAINECAGTVNENAETVSENAETVNENAGAVDENAGAVDGFRLRIILRARFARREVLSGQAFADADMETLRNKLNELLLALRR